MEETVQPMEGWDTGSSRGCERTPCYRLRCAASELYRSSHSQIWVILASNIINFSPASQTTESSQKSNYDAPITQVVGDHFFPETHILLCS